MSVAIRMISKRGRDTVLGALALIDCKASQPAAVENRQTVLNPNIGVVTKITNQVTVEQPLERALGNGAPW